MIRSRTGMTRALAALLGFPLLACGGATGDDLAQTRDGLRPPSWIGNAGYAITRCSSSACPHEVRPLTEPFRYDEWAVTRAATTELYFEVWEPGVTDWDNPDLWQTLDARLYFRVAGHDTFDWEWANLAGRAGNNARYASSLRALDPFFDPTLGGRRRIETAADCPDFPLRVGQDPGTVEADLEMIIWVNGAELRPADGGLFRGTYAMAVRDPALCAAPAIIDQVGRDTTVLQAWLGDRLAVATQGPSLGGTRFDPALCDGDDCTAAAQAVLRLPGSDRVSPFVNRFTYSQHLSGLCEVIELRTVTRHGALEAESFGGIGFWFSGAFSFTPEAALHPVGEVRLNDGGPATVHRFLARGMCFGLGGNSGSIAARHFEFKPFAGFDTPSARYRVWDDVRDDYRLGRSADGLGFITGFDRQGELLAP